MKNCITLCLSSLFFVLFSTSLTAQCDLQVTIDNPGMEDWADEGNYEDPAGDFWDTANRTVDLLPLVLSPNVTKDPDAHSGNYSAKLTTSNWFGLVTSATLFSGVFDPNQANPLESVQFGKPFTDRPDFFRFWYKYQPFEGDSAETYTHLTRWNSTTNTRDTVGTAYAKVYDAVSTWTMSELAFTYYSAETPDSISIVFASSSRGDVFQGQVGNTIYIDDIELCTTTGISQPLMSETSVTAFPNPVEDGNIFFQLDGPDSGGSIRVFANDGKEIMRKEFDGQQFDLDVSDCGTGVYRFMIYGKSSAALSSGSFIVK